MKVVASLIALSELKSMAEALSVDSPEICGRILAIVKALVTR